MVPAISIIVPVFNTGDYLKKCLKSLLDQSLEDLEIICVDNGSSDGSDVVAQDFAEREARVQFLSYPEGRQGDARNAGMSVATGEYVGFVDSDDFCEVDMFSRLHARAEKTGADIAICNIRCFWDGKEDSWVMIDPATLREGEGFRVFERPSLFRNFTICNRIFRRIFLNALDLRFPEGLWHEDQFFVGKALYAADRIVTVPDCLYNYRKGHEGSVGVHDGERNLDVFTVMNLLFDYVSSCLDSDAKELAEEVKIVRYLGLYPSCGPRVSRDYYERMRAEFREMGLPAEVQLLKNSEIREVRIASGPGGYLAYSTYLALRKLYGAIRQAGRAT